MNYDILQIKEIKDLYVEIKILNSAFCIFVCYIQ